MAQSMDRWTTAASAAIRTVRFSGPVARCHGEMQRPNPVVSDAFSTVRERVVADGRTTGR
jgi:hypothetical protein